MESPMLDSKNVEVTIRTSTSSSSNQFIPDNLELPDDTFRMSLDNFPMVGENVTIGRGMSVDSSVAGNPYTPSIELPSPLPTPDLQTPDSELPDPQTPDIDFQTPGIETIDLEAPDGQTKGIEIIDLEKAETKTTGIVTIDLVAPNVQTTGIETIDLKKADTQTTGVETIDLEAPKFQTTGIETIDLEAPDVQTPDIETIDLETPDIQTPGIETSDTETLVLQTPELETSEIQTPDIETPDVETPGLEMPDVHIPDVETPDVQTPPPENKSPPIIETPKQVENKTEIRRPQTLLKLSLSKKSDNDLFVKPSPVAELMSPARMLQFEVEASSATPTMKRAAVDFDFFSKNNFEEYFVESEAKEDKKSEDPGDGGTYKETPVIVKANTVRHEIGYGK